MTFWKRLFGPAPAPPPRLVALVNRVDDLDERVEYLSMELKRLRGRVTGAERKAQDATNEEPEAPEYPPAMMARPVPQSAHLSRRFRIGG